MLHIGLDLDNTIIDYDCAFVLVGEREGLLPENHGLAGKLAVKRHLLASGTGEAGWMRLQGLVYGRDIELATLSPGADTFIRVVTRRGGRISIVSHKTRHGHFDRDRVNLWDAARGWLARRGFFDAGGLALDPADLHFEETRERKLARIAAIGCRVFVDDLSEVLLDPMFPRDVAGLWLAGDQPEKRESGLTPYPDWQAIETAIQRYLDWPPAPVHPRLVRAEEEGP